MGYYLGIDGGGTKTLFCLADERGTVLSTWKTIGISYRQYSMDEVCQRLQEGTRQCLAAAGRKEAALSAVCIGYPGYGESKPQDGELERRVRTQFAPVPVILVNDVEIAWAGALNGAPGIHVVCGTGSIAYGGNQSGERARCGGWLDFFSDEGSGYWLGRKAMQIFSQQADGREKKGPLYEILRKHLKLCEDGAFIDCMAKEFIPWRDRVASLQMPLLTAAREGDETAKRAYAQAVKELVRLVKALKDRLCLPDGCSVTYSGSLFLAEDLILTPFRTAVAAIGGKVTPPEKDPVEGAVQIARKTTEGKI